MVDHEKLARAVVLQAVVDTTAQINPQRTGVSASRPQRHEQDDARAFCLATEGEWAEAREAWCDAAGLDPDWVHGGAWTRIVAHLRGAAPNA